MYNGETETRSCDACKTEIHDEDHTYRTEDELGEDVDICVECLDALPEWEIEPGVLVEAIQENSSLQYSDLLKLKEGIWVFYSDTQVVLTTHDSLEEAGDVIADYYTECAYENGGVRDILAFVNNEKIVPSIHVEVIWREE